MGTEVSIVTFPALADARMDMAKSLRPAHERARAEWEAFASKARLEQFRLQMKLDELGSHVRKAKKRQAFDRTDWEGLRLRDPRARARAKYNI
jgi:hypothetical protein